jgi:hypothetical protein
VLPKHECSGYTVTKEGNGGWNTFGKMKNQRRNTDFSEGKLLINFISPLVCSQKNTIRFVYHLIKTNNHGKKSNQKNR